MRISMAHGSGGLATRDLVNAIFKKNFSNPYLDHLDDAALLPASSYPPALTTDSFVVTPLFFPGGNIGKLAVYGTVNDLWMMGAEPKYLTAGFILEEGLELATLEKVVSAMGQAARETGVAIVAGDTKVVEGKGGLYINTAGLGYRLFPGELGSSLARPGDLVIVSGALGNHHACILSRRMGIDNNITSDCASLGPLVKPLLAAGLEVHVLRDVTRGGLATVLNEIAEASAVDIALEEARIPVDPEVAGFCEILGLDALYMANEGKFVCVVAKKDGEEALRLIREQDQGAQAAVIGTVELCREKPRVILQTPLGGKRIIDVLSGEGLPRIC